MLRGVPHELVLGPKLDAGILGNGALDINAAFAKVAAKADQMLIEADTAH